MLSRLNRLSLFNHERRLVGLSSAESIFNYSRHSRSSSTPRRGKEDARLLLTRLNAQRKTITAGLPTGVYWPVNLRRRPPLSMRNVVMLSPLWLHTNRKFPEGSMLQLRG